MTQEALKLALEGVEIHSPNSPEYIVCAALIEALAQTQEPVGDEWTPCMKLPVVVYVRKQRLGEAHISTREGITPVKPDDLIMRGVSGEEYPIGRAIFEQTYSLATTPPQRKPLTFWQKDEMTFKAKISQEMSPVEIYLQGISDAEVAHSIKE